MSDAGRVSVREGSMSACSRFVLCVVAALMLGGCRPADPYHIPYTGDRYPRWEAPGYYGARKGMQNIYWADDERALFIGQDLYGAEGQPTLRLWNVRTNEVQDIGPAKGHLCFFRGWLTYVLEDGPDVRIHYEGPLDAIKVVSLKFGQYVEDFRKRALREHMVDCTHYSEHDFEPDAKCKVPLLPGDGYLEYVWGPCNEARKAELDAIRRIPDRDARNAEEVRWNNELGVLPLVHHRPGHSPTVLPIQALEFSRGLVTYLDWAEAYQITPNVPKNYLGIDVGPWPQRDLDLYLLRSDASVATVTVPVGDWFNFRPSIMRVTRVGVAAKSPGVTKNGKRKDQGLILFRDSGIEEVERNWVEEIAVSPNGCRLAYRHRTIIKVDGREMGQSRVRAIDVCERRI